MHPADISISAAALAGVVSFLSPCVLPLVPGYLAFVSGAPVSNETGLSGAPQARVVGRAVAFVLGFSMVFALPGASATAVGQVLLAHATVLQQVAGLIVVLFGVHLLGISRIPLLYRERRAQLTTAPRSHAGAFLVGGAFAFGWTPCIGPILGGVLALAAVQHSAAQGMGLLAVYSLGLRMPFVLAALGASCITRVFVRSRRVYRGIELASGVLLIAIGLFIASGRLTWLSAQFGILRRFAL